MSIVYGSFPGVRARVTGSRLGGVVLGRTQKAVIFGTGDTTEGDGQPNNPYQIQTRTEANRLFGANSEISLQLQKALNNGARKRYLYGIMAQEYTVEEETINGQGSLQFGPIVNTDNIQVIETSSGETVEYELTYDNEFAQEDVAQGVRISVTSGRAVHAEGNSFNLQYDYADFESAIDNADRVVRHGENGIYSSTIADSDVNNTLEDKVADLRPGYRMINNVVGHEPNSQTDDGSPAVDFDVDALTHSLDSDYTFSHSPVHLRPLVDAEGNEVPSPDTVLGGLVGIYAGNFIDDPVIGESVSGYNSELAQKINTAEADRIRKSRVNPVVDDSLNGVGGIFLEDNLSTSTSDDWKRDYQRRRTVDQTLLIAREVGEQARNRLITDDLLTFIKNTITEEIKKLVRIGILRGSVRPYGLSEEEYAEQQEARRSSGNDEAEEDPYFVEVEQTGPDEVTITIGITPAGVNKRVDQRIIVEDYSTTGATSASPL